ncbi:MAG: hypothetical protein P4L84_14750 [Isosphaeraceae bacterium]|nr:hypothetical protein [Isosphaeraceae bacterium]
MIKYNIRSVAARSARTYSPWVAIILVLGGAGCGGGGDSAKPFTGSLFPVTGKILLADGKPLKGGRVIFMPKELGAPPAIGDIGADGAFSLKLADGREGAPAGDYKVKIDPDPSMMVKRGKVKIPPFPVIYTEEDGETGLTATVKSEPTQLEPFKLAPPQADSKSRRDRD